MAYSKFIRAFPPGGFVPWWGPGASDIAAIAPPAHAISQMWSGSGTFPVYALELTRKIDTASPQEYPKTVPGPNGPQVVHDGAEEFEALRARLVKLGPTPSLATNETMWTRPTVPVYIDVDAWCREREASQHDWIGALYRPYEPPV